jgi:hypothetical protein
MYDEYCRKKIRFNPNMLIPWWIMAAYAYEVEDDPIISDALFDEIAVRIKNEWDDIDHWHKPLLDRDMVKSAIAIDGKYPTRAIEALKAVRKIK